ERFEDQYRTEREMLQVHHQRQLEQIQAFRDNGYITEVKYNQLIEDETRRHEGAVTDITESEMFARNQLASNMLTQMSGLMSSKYRALFEIGKAAALANIA